jgi:LPPG:FO 2-phospho-L-lactate transferase
VSAILESEAVIICPSNPFISIGPILAVPGVRDALRETPATVAAVTPIIGGKALKGPAAEMLRDLGYEVSATAVAKMYDDLLDIFILDSTDAESAADIQYFGVRVLCTDTVMNTLDDKQHLARRVVEGLKPPRDIRVTESGATSI